MPEGRFGTTHAHVPPLGPERTREILAPYAKPFNYENAEQEIEALIQRGDFAALQALEADPLIPFWMKAQFKERIKVDQAQKQQKAQAERDAAYASENQRMTTEYWNSQPAGAKEQADATHAAANARMAAQRGVSGGTDTGSYYRSPGYTQTAVPATPTQPTTQPAQMAPQSMYGLIRNQRNFRAPQYRPPKAPSIIPSTYQSLYRQPTSGYRPPTARY